MSIHILKFFKTCGTRFWQAKARWGAKHSPFLWLLGFRFWASMLGSELMNCSGYKHPQRARTHAQHWKQLFSMVSNTFDICFQIQGLFLRLLTTLENVQISQLLEFKTSRENLLLAKWCSQNFRNWGECFAPCSNYWKELWSCKKMLEVALMR